MNRGEKMKPEIERAIKESRGSIVVLSKNYATSSWCLDELVLILEQKRECNHFVVPVFYGVDPTDVKNQRGSFAIQVKPASLKWTDDNVNKWKIALMEVANLAGHVLSGRYETSFLKEIVDTAYRNPLALEVLGTSLFKNDTVRYWESRLSLFGRDIDSRIQDVLILEPDYSAIAGIGILTSRCLLSVSPNKKLRMHRLVQEMGKNIVRQESDLPAKRSRVWLNSDSYEILKKGKGAKRLQGLALNMKMLAEENFTLKLMEIGRLTRDWFRILVGDTIDNSEVRGWRKNGRPKQVNPSFTELKTVRCIIHGPQLEVNSLPSTQEMYGKQKVKSGDEITMDESDLYSYGRYPVVDTSEIMEISALTIKEEPPRVVDEDKVYVAVGKNMKESQSTLQWALHNSGGRKICILHVHQPAKKIPLSNVSAEVHYIEVDSVEKGIVEFILQHNVRRLVMGGAADKHYSKKMTNLRSKKAIYVRALAAPSCRIQFICKGNAIFTRILGS
ncbi:hypothetical protein L1987_64796 [Smallanthus sonchifolius]|uniref:Uncharacterized protein n=1 Tax=Smallanthus sonchifolius TaxID=185202 RepID=A0ACB9BSQ0_9ASTR|nr:hypothetical protein L1987_64796 [Smallanthus sonchifolius]